jgi:arginyl-tRNA synthetase
MQSIISEIIKKSLKEEGIKITSEEIKKLIEIPPNTEMGDYAFPCFSFSSQLKKNPNQIALDIRQNIGNPPKQFQDIQTKGPYINFFVDRNLVAEKLIPSILSQNKNYGKIILKKHFKTMVEFPSPNTNKPLHLGHLRNMSIGESVSRILEFNGEKIVRANLNNDRGIHICKSMAAYEKYGKNKKPSKKIKSDHLVGDFYVMFNKKLNDKLDVRSHEMLRLWEQGDKKIHALWKKMNAWALNGFKETYENFGIKHDVEFFESEIYEKGREIVEQGVKDKVFEKKEDNSISINLEKEKIGEKILLRSDGTSIYMTQDLHLAKLKFKKYKIDKSIYVVGNEQDYHFKVLFSILKKVGFKKEMHHLSYGMVELPEGKMKSREGIVVDADELIGKVQNLVRKELEKREKLSKKELEKRSLVIALASIKYLLLKTDTKKRMVFDPKKSISFEGDTGPYLLYTYARASSILKKAKTKQKNIYLGELEQKEIDLIKKLEQFPEAVLKAHKNLSPSIIANYSYQLCQIFNEFYHACPVIGSKKQMFRLNLVESLRIVLKNSLFLLGIETLEKM